MRRMLWFAGGIAVGYVLGSRAGRQTYDDLVAGTRKIMDHPTVQEAAGVVQAQASRLYDEGMRRIGGHNEETAGEKTAAQIPD